MQKKRKKQAVTLIEIMIVILLIGLIGGALAFNMRGSMDKGRVFKSQQNCARVYEALMMASATGEFNCENDYSNIDKIKVVIKNSPLIKDPEKVLFDAWGEPIQFAYEQDDLKVFSQRANNWETAHQAQ